MKFALGTVNRAFGIKEEFLLDAFGQDSGLTEIFYCHGMVGIVVMLYLNHIVYRKDFNYDNAIHYVSMLSDEDKHKVALEIIEQLFPNANEPSAKDLRSSLI